MKLIPIREACSIFRLTVPSLKALARKDPTFPAYQIEPPNGPWRVDLDGVDGWNSKQREKTLNAHIASCRGKGGGIFEMPEHLRRAEAGYDLHFVLKHGAIEEGRHLVNHASLCGEADADICAGFGLPLGASWGAVVRRAEKFLSLSAEQRAISKAFIARRLADFYAAQVDALAENVQAPNDEIEL